MKDDERDLLAILEERYEQFPKEDLKILANLPADKRTKLNEIMNKGEFLQVEFNKAYYEKDQKMLDLLSKINIELGQELDDMMGSS